MTLLDRIREAREAERKMTKGPWRWEDPVPLTNGNESRCLSANGVPVLRHEAITWSVEQADASGIAILRNLAPDLLPWAEAAHKRIEYWQREAAKWRTLLEELRDGIDEALHAPVILQGQEVQDEE